MSADDILFEPLIKNTTATSIRQIDGIMRFPNAIWAEVRTRTSKKTYTDLATEIINFAVSDMPSLTDVRLPASYRPSGAIDLVAVVSRFHDGGEELWISRPKHMKATEHRFTGRFGYERACKMPTDHSKIGILTWYWIDTDDGRLPAIDLGLMLYHPSNKWWRVFTNKNDATEYYNS